MSSPSSPEPQAASEIDPRPAMHERLVRMRGADPREVTSVFFDLTGEIGHAVQVGTLSHLDARYEIEDLGKIGGISPAIFEPLARSMAHRAGIAWAQARRWPTPMPLPRTSVPAEPLDTAWLPPAIAPWVRDVAERLQCPPDYVAMPALAALGAALGRKVGIRPWRHFERTVFARFGVVIVGPPGALKDAAIAEALKPLRLCENRKRSDAPRSPSVIRRDDVPALLRALDGVDAVASDRGFTDAAGPLNAIATTEPGFFAGRSRSAGRLDDRLLRRFNLVVWPDPPTQWRDVARPANDDARQTACDVFTRLATLVRPADGATALGLEAAAAEALAAWRAAFETRLREGTCSPALESHLAAQRELVPMLALIDHLAQSESGAIGLHPVRRAIQLAAYLESHARRLADARSLTSADCAEAILRKIDRGELTDGFSAREIKQKEWSDLTDGEAIESALALLVDHDWLCCETVRTSGRPRIVYRISPRGRRPDRKGPAADAIPATGHF